MNEILDYAFPITAEDRGCKMKMQKKMAQREKLRLMVDRYRNGEIVKFEPLCIGIDIEELMKRFNN